MKKQHFFATISTILLLSTLSMPVLAKEVPAGKPPALESSAAVNSVTELPIEIAFISQGIPYHMSGVIVYDDTPHFKLTDTNLMWFGTAATPFLYAPLDPSTPLIYCTDKMLTISNVGYGDMTINGASLDKEDGFSLFMDALGGEKEISPDGLHVINTASVSGSDSKIEVDYLTGEGGSVLSCPTMRIVF